MWMFVIRSSHCEYVRRRLCRCVRSCMFGITRAQHRHMRCVAVCGCFGDNDCCEPPPMTMCAPRTHDTSHKAHLSAYGAHSMVPYAIPNNEPSRVYTLRVCVALLFSPCSARARASANSPIFFSCRWFSLSLVPCKYYTYVPTYVEVNLPGCLTGGTQPDLSHT